MEPKKEMISKLTQVYLDYGIIPISKKYKSQFPSGKKSLKIEAVFDSYKKIFPLTFDPSEIRFFGVKGWYKEHGAKPGDYVMIEPIIPKKRYRFSYRSKKQIITKKDELERIKLTSKAGRELSLVGKPINYGGLVYAPVNEMGVVLLFGMIYEEMGMIVEEIRNRFPDAVIRRFNGRGWVRELAEFEFKSSHFKRHKHSIKKCDILICWENDWNRCPLEVWELANLIKIMPRDILEKSLK